MGWLQSHLGSLERKKYICRRSVRELPIYILLNYDLGQIVKGQNETPWLFKVTITPYKSNQKNILLR